MSTSSESPATGSENGFRYHTAQEQLPPEIRAQLSELRRRERNREIPSAVTNQYLDALHEAGWTFRVLANAFDNVVVEAVRERILRAREGQVESVPVQLGESDQDRRVIEAWQLWAQLTSRPDAETPNREFVTAYREMLELGYPHEGLLRDIRGAALTPPRPRDPRDVRRVIMPLTNLTHEERVLKLLNEGIHPIHPFPNTISPGGREGEADPETVARLLAELPPVPEPKRRESAHTPAEVQEQKYRIPQSTVERLQELQSVARLVKGTTPQGHPNREASEQLARLMYQEYQRGATYYQIAQATGTTWNAIKFRLGRYGFVSLPPSMADTFVRDIRTAEERGETEPGSHPLGLLT